MPGNAKQQKTIRERKGKHFMSQIGFKGAAASGSPFQRDPELARRAGAKGWETRKRRNLAARRFKPLGAAVDLVHSYIKQFGSPYGGQKVQTWQHGGTDYTGHIEELEGEIWVLLEVVNGKSVETAYKFTDINQLINAKGIDAALMLGV